MTRRFNAWTLMERTTRLKGGKHLSGAGALMAWTRQLGGRSTPFREPMSRKRPCGRRKVRVGGLYAPENDHLFSVEAALEAFRDVPIDGPIEAIPAAIHRP